MGRYNAADGNAEGVSGHELAGEDMIPLRLFDRLEIETQSSCNRVCPTCLRNSFPDRAAVGGYFEARQMPAAQVCDLIDQAVALGFRGTLFLSFYNEPLLDSRLAELAHYAQAAGEFEVSACTNGDLLTAELAAQLDGAFDTLRVALYDAGHDEELERLMGSWFQRTRLTFTGGRHIPRHFTCLPAYAALIADQPCEMESQQRMCIRHDGELLLCCEDIQGEWGLGNVAERSLRDLWFGEPHASRLQALAQPGGRSGYCLTCPQPNVPYWSVR
jgi:hypothetical protein